MTNTRRTVAALVLALSLLTATGLLLKARLLAFALFFLVFRLAETTLICYAASRGKAQISGRQSLSLFWTYVKHQKFYYLFISILSLALIWQSQRLDINPLFCMGILGFLLLSTYTMSSHGIEPEERKSLF